MRPQRRDVARVRTPQDHRLRREQGRPSPLSDEEVKEIVDQMTEDSSKRKPKVMFRHGEPIRVRRRPLHQLRGVGGRGQRRAGQAQGHGEHLRTLHPRRARLPGRWKIIVGGGGPSGPLKPPSVRNRDHRARCVTRDGQAGSSQSQAAPRRGRRTRLPRSGRR